MAMESACKLSVGRDRYEGKVRMDGGFIDFQGQTKFRFRLAEIRNPRQEGTSICFDFHGNAVEIVLSERASGRWIEYILNPQSLADKLGIREGQSVRVLNIDDPDLIASLQSKSARVVHGNSARCDMVLLGVERNAELRQIGDLQENLLPGGSIWVVLTKTVRTVTKANVITMAREAGLSQVKAVDYSETRAAYKMMRPGEDRPVPKRGGGNGHVEAPAPAANRLSAAESATPAPRKAPARPRAKVAAKVAASEA